MANEPKYGKTSTVKRSEVRGLMTDPARPGLRVEIVLRGEEGRWAFEAVGPRGLSARSNYVFASQKEAAEVAEGMASALLDVGGRAAASFALAVEAARAKRPGPAAASLSPEQQLVARAHFDLLRAIAEGAGHGLDTTPGVRPLCAAGLLTINEVGLAVMTPAGKLALAAVRKDCEGTPLDHRHPRAKLP